MSNSSFWHVTCQNDICHFDTFDTWQGVDEFVDGMEKLGIYCSVQVFLYSRCRWAPLTYTDCRRKILRWFGQKIMLGPDHLFQEQRKHPDTAGSRFRFRGRVSGPREFIFSPQRTEENVTKRTINKRTTYKIWTSVLLVIVTERLEKSKCHKVKFQKHVVNLFMLLNMSIFPPDALRE